MSNAKRQYAFLSIIKEGNLCDLTYDKSSRSVQFNLDPELDKNARSVLTFFLRPSIHKMFSGDSSGHWVGYDSLESKSTINSHVTAHATVDIPGWRAWQAVVPAKVLTVEQNTLVFELINGNRICIDDVVLHYKILA
jgi:hypothetical protein